MATVYSGSRWNSEGTTGWRIRVDYSTNSASIYADVVTSYSSSSIWLRFTTGNNTVTKSANTYYSSNNGKSGNLLGTISISPYSAYTVYETCSGSAWGGSVNGESSVTIPKQSSPPAPTCSVSITNIGVDRATCIGQITNNPENYWRIHLYNTGGSWQTYATGTSSCSFTQTGLAHNTTYNFYHQYTNNSDGEGSGLIAHSFTTSGNAPTINSVTPAPARTTCSLANNSISYDTNASFSSVSVRYGTSTSYGSTASSTNLTGLAANTTYYYSMTVTDNWGRTSAAKTGSFTTTGNAPSIGTVYNLPWVGFGEFNADVTYDTNAAFSSIEVQYGTSTSYGSTSNSWRIPQTGATLTHNTIYYYRFRITDTKGRTSDWKTSNMLISGNGPVISNVSGTPGETTYDFTYTATYDTNAGYYSISVEYGTTTSYGSSATSTSLTGLTPETHYYYRFRVLDTKTHFSNWYTGEFTTLASTTLKIKVNGVWKDATPYINVNGTWKKAKAYKKINGTWKQGKS